MEYWPEAPREGLFDGFAADTTSPMSWSWRFPIRRYNSLKDMKANEYEFWH
jgi:hypothetical protein